MSLWDEIGEIGQNFVDAYKDLGNAIGNFIDDPLGSLEDAFNGIMDIMTYGTFSYLKDAFRGYVAGLLPEQDFKDRKRTIRSSTEPKRVIYGRNRVGGQLVYLEDQGKDNIVLWMCFVLAGHEVEHIESVLADGEVVATGTPGFYGLMDRPSNSFGNNIACWMVHGNTPAGLIPTLGVTSSDSSYNGTFKPPNWTTSHKLSYQSYVWVALIYDDDEFGDTGVPKFEFVVKGKNDIYDPRTGTSGYTDNQALIALDVILWDRMMGEDLSAVNVQEFIDGANICDQQVASGVGVTEKRYTTNGTFRLQAVPLDILSSISSAGASECFFDLASGKWRYVPGVYNAPVMDLNEDDLVGGVSFQAGPPKNSKHNIANGTYIDPDQGYEAIGFQQLYISGYVNDDLEELEKNFDFAWTQSPTMARRLAKIDIERSRFGITCSAVFKFKAIKLSPGDRINLSIESLGWQPKIFRIEEVEVSFEKGVALSLREDSVDVYSWSEGDALAIDVPPVLSIPSGLSISSPTSVSFSEEIYSQLNNTKSVKVNAEWADQRSATAYDVQYKDSGAATWISLATFWQDNSFEIQNLNAGNYDFRVRAINSRRSKSSWYQTTFSVTGFISQAPASISITALNDTPKTPIAQFTTLRVTVTPPADPTYSYAVVEYKKASSTAWLRGGLTDANNIVDIVVNTNGETYDVRAFSVSASETTGVTAVSQQIVILDSGNNGDVQIISPLTAVTNLEVAGGGTTFTGRDAVITWTDPNFSSLLVRNYQVVIKDGSNNLMRTVSVSTPIFTYTYEMNVNDYEQFNAAPGVNRSFTVEVKVVGRLDDGAISHVSSATLLSISNPAPTAPSSIVMNAGYQQIRLEFLRPSDLDYVETRIYMSTTAGLTPGVATYVTSAYDGSVTIGSLQEGQTYYFKFVTFDVYGAGATSPEFSETTESAPSSGGPWSTITVADLAFIDQYVDDDAVTSQKIESVVAGKIATGTLAATTQVSVGNPATEPYTVIIGAKTYTGEGVALLSAQRNSNSESMFAFFESGDIKLNANATVSSDGSVLLGDQTKANAYLEFDKGTGKVTLKGELVIIAATGYNNLTDKPTSLSGINSSEGSKLGGIAPGADVTGSNTSADTTNVDGTAASTVKANAALGATFTSTDAGGLAYSDAVDMATTQVINKNADNIAETVSKKWAAESGANVTENNKSLSVITPDTRSTNPPPTYYRNLGRGIYPEFKQTSTMGIGAGTYGFLVTQVKWTSTGGGRVTQEFYDDNDVKFRRRSNSADTGWEAWKKSFDENAKPDLGSDILNNIADNIGESTTRKWAGQSGADVTDYTNPKVANAISQAGSVSITRPLGGAYKGSVSTSGYIKITLPQSWTNTMLRFSVDVYNYSTDTSFTVTLGGYTYSTTSVWYNTFAFISGNLASDNTVRFGHDGSRCCVFIGESNSNWPYVDVLVRDFQGGQSGASVSNWEDDWDVQVVSTLPTNIDRVITDALLDARSIKNQGTLATRNDVAYTELTGSKPPSNATYGADWATTLFNIPNELTSTPNNGLNLTPTYMGYYNNGWKSYIQNNGSVFLGDFGSGQYIDFDSGTGVLQLGPKTSIGSNENRTVTVNSSGADFTSLSAAIEALSRTVAVYKDGGFTYDIVIQSGFVIAEQLHFDGVDLSNIRITAIDSMVTVDYTALTASPPGNTYEYFILATNGAVSPVIDFNFKQLDSGFDRKIAVYSSGVGSTVILGGITIQDFFDCIEGIDQGQIQIRGDITFNGLELFNCITLSSGASLSCNGGITGTDGLNLITMSTGAKANVSGGLTCSAGVNTCLSMSSGSEIQAAFITATNGSNSLIIDSAFVNISGTININDGLGMILSNATVFASGNISAERCTTGINASSSNIACNNLYVNNCTSRGFDLDKGCVVRTLGDLYAELGAGGSYGIIAYASDIFVGNILRATGNFNGIYTVRGGRINVFSFIYARTGNNTSTTTSDTFVDQGSVISCNSFNSGANVTVNTFNSKGQIYD